MSATQSRWSRVTVAVGVCALVVWQLAAVVGVPQRTAVALGLYGFVLHVVFGKAYALVPSYFDRDLAVRRAPLLSLPFTAVGAVGLAVAPFGWAPSLAGPTGAAAWAIGVTVVVATLAWTVRDNPTGSETGTGEHNADRQPLDRLANAFVPVVGLYLLVGTWATGAAALGLPGPLDGYPPRATHLLAAGGAALLVFAVGFRLLPRFLVASVPRPLPWVVLPGGAIGPALLAVGLPAGPVFRAGALMEATAVIGFALAYAALLRATDRGRVGFYGPALGSLAGVAGVALGLWFAFAARSPSLVATHLRLNLLGLLGLTIAGVTFQFYPPTVGRFPGASDRTALVALGLLAGGLAVELAGTITATDAGVATGRGLAVVGAVCYAYLVLGVFVQQART
jgi:hypothetical protein